MSTSVDVPSVNSAVQHLDELAERMKSDFGFEETDVHNIDNVIEALHELEAQRSAVHDRLETYTIKASIQRHRLQFLPGQVSKEISDAVNSARQSNADALAQLKQQLENINKNIVFLEQHQKHLDEENAILHPERELIRQQHEEIISQLNQRMAEKASMQIQLNETRDKVRQTNQDIIELEDGILQLKEDLITERTEARSEKQKLKKVVAQTADKTKEQRQLNVSKKRDLDKLHERQMDSEGKLDALRRSLRRYETSKAKLEGQERALNAQLQKQLKQNDDLRKRGANIASEDLKIQKEFTDNERQLDLKLKRLEYEIEQESSRFEDLDDKRTGYTEDLELKMVVRAADAERVADLDEQLQQEKRNLAMKAEEVGKMQAENVDMNEQKEMLVESHKAVLAQLNKQIEDYREQLAKERRDRLEVQDRKNSVSKELDDYKVENKRFMQEMNTTITSGKSQHVDLSNEQKRQKDPIRAVEQEGVALQRQLRADEDEITRLQQEVEEEQQRYQEKFTRLQNNVDAMERDVIEMEHGIAEKTQKIEDLTPMFEQLEKAFEDRSDEYEKLKKNIVALKTKKTALGDELRKTKIMKDMLKDPQEQLHVDLKKKREEAISQIKRNGEDTRNIESEIYVRGCKLKTVMEENQKFGDACAQLDADIHDVDHQMGYNESLKDRLLQELQQTKSELEKSWMTDLEIQQRYTDRDQVVVDELGHLLERTEKRELKIADITGHLEVELANLTNFLENLASRRPKGNWSASTKRGSYRSQCVTPKPDSAASRRPGSRGELMSRESMRSCTPLEAVEAANRAEVIKPLSRQTSRPPTSMSGRNVVISEEVTDLQSRLKTPTKMGQS